jgi:hypothetical protein
MTTDRCGFTFCPPQIKVESGWDPEGDGLTDVSDSDASAGRAPPP